MSEFRNRAVVGIGWTTAARIGSQTLQFLISITLARLLMPRDFGLIGMIIVFVGFAALFGELGFGAALIQRQDVDGRHYSTIFWLNMLTGLALTGLFVALAPFVASFYSEPRLTRLTMLIASNFSIASWGMVPNAILRRGLDFRSLALVEVVSVLAGGAVAIVLAIMGHGVWSLAWQILTTSGLSVVMLWLLTGWRPSLSFDRLAVKELLGFSSNLVGFQQLNYWVRNGDDMLIGRFFGSGELGAYTRAYQTMLLPVSQITAALGRVMFPTLSKIQSDRERVKRIYLRSIAMIALLTFPMMLGLLVVSENFVLALYGRKWIAVIPILRIFCLLGMVQSIGATTGWIFQSQGRTDLMFRWGLGAGTLLMLSVLAGIMIGSSVAVAAAYSFTSGIVLLYPSFAIPGKLIDMTFRDVARVVTGIFGCALVMALVVLSVELVLPPVWPSWAYLAIQVPIGIAVYFGLVHLFGVGAYQDVRDLALEQWQVYRSRRRPSAGESVEEMR
jgi:PST family polysaccharide transporter